MNQNAYFAPIHLLLNSLEWVIFLYDQWGKALQTLLFLILIVYLPSYSERIHETEKHLSHVQKEASILAEAEVPKLIDENAELQATQVLYGDYNLKLARQDYFTSKQDEVGVDMRGSLMGRNVEVYKLDPTSRMGET